MKINYKLFILVVCTLFAINVCTPNKIESQKTPDNRIVIKYSHSRRIPQNKIICTLYETFDGEYKMRIETIAMTYSKQNWNMEDENTRKYVESEEFIERQIHQKNIMEELAKDNINILIDIEKDFFEQISRKIWNINLSKIIRENKNSNGRDGS
jgi:hypothetical protein